MRRWTVAIGVPLGVAIVLRRRDAVINAIAAAWTIALIAMGPGCHPVKAQEPRKEEKGNPLHPKDDG